MVWQPKSNFRCLRGCDIIYQLSKHFVTHSLEEGWNAQLELRCDIIYQLSKHFVTHSLEEGWNAQLELQNFVAVRDVLVVCMCPLVL